jgi:tetratricopeptide (TPR) repeat protein
MDAAPALSEPPAWTVNEDIDAPPPRTGVPPRTPPDGAPSIVDRLDPSQGRPDDQFVDLSQWLKDNTAAARPVEDFNDMLSQFKEGVAANLSEEDAGSHYDLGVAYKEMGLLSEAIAEFQKSLRTPAFKARSYEAVGQAFFEQKRYDLAITSLQRALREPDLTEEELVGVLYLLGYSMEAQGNNTEATRYYRRVVAVDVKFRDALTRLNALQSAG